MRRSGDGRILFAAAAPKQRKQWRKASANALPPPQITRSRRRPRQATALIFAWDHGVLQVRSPLRIAAARKVGAARVLWAVFGKEFFLLKVHGRSRTSSWSGKKEADGARRSAPAPAKQSDWRESECRSLARPRGGVGSVSPICLCTGGHCGAGYHVPP